MTAFTWTVSSGDVAGKWHYIATTEHNGVRYTINTPFSSEPVRFGLDLVRLWDGMLTEALESGEGWRTI